jgi:hypothetical protein
MHKFFFVREVYKGQKVFAKQKGKKNQNSSAPK